MSRLIQAIRKFKSVQPAAKRHLLGRNARPYERILQHIASQKDIWLATQGDYMQWWCEREALSLTVQVAQGQCHVRVSSPRAVIEQFPGKFLESESVPCPQTSFTGECVITVDSAMQHKATLIELLRREGILNFRIGSDGEFLLPAQELDPILERANANLEQRMSQPDGEDVRAVREIVLRKLAAHNLPLLRVWYHPRIEGVVVKAVFSPRYDVDRAITNMASIRAIEMKYGVESTFYIRSFCLFYTDQAVEELSTMPWCPELAVHGEFVTNARTYGDEYKAALAEKAHLEKIVRRPVRGVGMHGGELTNNRSEYTHEAQRRASFLYDTTTRPYPGNYLPFRKIINGQFSNVYGLPHSLSDVNIEADRRYGQTLYAEAIEMMRRIYEANGVFVLMLHPEYFGFFAYLSRPSNLVALVKFLRGFLTGAGQSRPRTGMATQERLVAE